MKYEDQSEYDRRELCLLRGIAAHWHLFAQMYFSEQLNDRRLRQPVFALHDSLAWGLWHGAPRRELSLRRDLVLNHKWDSVLEVLRHEMAHQVAEELYGGSCETAHGPAFQRAAAQLHVSSRASSHYTLLEDRAFAAENAADTAGDRVLARVRKLLALASSPEPAEAELAMQKAQELLDRYQLDIVNASVDDEEFFAVFIGTPALRHDKASKILAAVLAQHFHVQALWVQTWVPAAGKMGSVVEISGRRVNVQSAHYAWDFVCGCIERAWQRHQAQVSRRQARTGFRLGMVRGFADKLTRHQQQQQRDLGEQALIVLRNDVRLQLWWRQRYPHVSRRKVSGSRVDAHAYAKGREQGEQIVLHRGIESAPENRGRFIGNS